MLYLIKNESRKTGFFLNESYNERNIYEKIFKASIRRNEISKMATR